MNRSRKALRNVIIGLLNKIILMLLAFSTRTLFIRMLGAEYAGISSLYMNILSVLSLAELGVGNVLMFYLYSALSKGDEDEICKLVREFKKIYNVIIICVLTVGMALIPFLQFIVKSELNSSELILYYVLYLINSVASYFVAYRTTVILADQKEYIISISSTITTAIMYIIQLIYLILFRKFLGYLIIQVGCTVVNNLLLNYVACKKYPYLKSKVTYSEKIVDKKELFKNIKATFLFKVSDMILDQTDNIIISIMFGTIFVGYYSNYFLIISYIGNIGGIITSGLTASFGNLNTEGNMEKSFKLFKVSMLLFSIIGTFCTACYACIIQDFIPLWVGRQFLMSYDIVVAIIAVFYLRMVTNTVWIYRSTFGLFNEVQYINLLAAVLNIVLSIILGKIIGISGVILATALSRLFTSFWFEGKVIFRKFNKSVWLYFKKQFKDFMLAMLIITVSFVSSFLVKYNGIWGISLKLTICAVVTLCLELLFNGRTEEFVLLLEKVKSSIRKNNLSRSGRRLS